MADKKYVNNSCLPVTLSRRASNLDDADVVIEIVES
jgi:hypothetical protein